MSGAYNVLPTAQKPTGGQIYNRQPTVEKPKLETADLNRKVISAVL